MDQALISVLLCGDGCCVDSVAVNLYLLPSLSKGLQVNSEPDSHPLQALVCPPRGVWASTTASFHCKEPTVSPSPCPLQKPHSKDMAPTC